MLIERFVMSKKIGSLVLLLIVIGLLVTGYRYISFRTDNAVSDAAFIKSDKLSLLSFKVGGKVEKLFVNENQKVKKGELLARIDPTDILLTQKELRHKLKSLTDDIAALQKKKERASRSLKLQSEISKTDIAAIEKEKKATAYEIESLQAKLTKLKNDEQRFVKMYKNRLISKSDLEKIQTQTKSLTKNIDAMHQKLLLLDTKTQKAHLAYKLAQIQEKQILELQKKIEAALQQQKALDASLEKIDKKLSYTKLYAPFDGIIAKKFFNAPKVIKRGSPVVALVDLDKLYCEVLLSEKKLKGVKVGNKVTINVDALEDREYTGKVSSIAPTSASTFSLVPRDIASGEFTKLDQRFVVRISLDDISDLRAGMGASVAIERE